MEMAYKITEVCGDWALHIPPYGKTDAEMILIFNSRNNAELVKSVLEWEDAHPNKAVPYKPTFIPPNEPLTLEQLREMDGEPVWDENGKCYLVDTTYRFCSCSDIEIAIVDKNGDVKRYPQRRALYRRPPEGEANA